MKLTAAPIVESEASVAAAIPATSDLPARWPMRRVVAWALVGIGALAFVVAGDVRTNWVIGDIGPEQGEVALPRLGTIAVLLGLALLARHQVISRRSLPDQRYRGPSVLLLLALIVGLSVFLVLPVRDSINLAIEGGIPDLPPVLIWIAATHLAALLVMWIVLRARPMPGRSLFADSRRVRHALIGVAVGIPTQIVVLALVVATGVGQEAFLQVPSGPPVGPFAPGVPVWLGVISSVVVAPVVEELFFRGLAFRAWLREYGPRAALIGTSVLFGLVHFGLNPLDGLAAELPRMAIIAGGGLVLGALALRTGSLTAPIAAHAAMNGVTVIISLAVLAGMQA
jgi:membrane protease YdiL (CAAX protease family)